MPSAEMGASNVTKAAAGTNCHPLDPLSAPEITAASAVVRTWADAQSLGALRFNVVSLQEPSKADLLAYEAGKVADLPRRAFVILQVPEVPSVYELVVELGASKVESHTLLEGVQPLVSPDDCVDAEAIAKADAGLVELLSSRYGLTNLDLVACDPWSVHAAPQEGRLVQLFMYNRSCPEDNQYAHPLDLLPLVDLNLKKVVRIDMQRTPPKVPSQDVNYHTDLFSGPLRQDLNPISITQPQGPSFQVEGNLLTWQKWRLRLGFNYREGLVLHTVGYQEGDRVRPVLHRASLVEMAVPYGDPHEPFQRKCAFDVGDYGLGYCTFPLTLGCDCLGHIQYLDAVLSNSAGEPVVLRNAMCLHEEDHGLLWKHVEWRNGYSESRRSRRMVISFVATVVNYEYCFYWYLYQDGTIGYEIKLTGELSTNLLSEGEGPAPGYGTLVAPGVNAQHHQHMFCARLDFAVDDLLGGKGLLVSEVDAVSMPTGPDNPHGNGFKAVERDLTTTSAAQRVVDPAKARIWKVKNPATLNPITAAPVAYKIILPGAATLLAQPDSMIAKRGVFATRNLWVTPHADDQKFPAGDYVLQSTECAGLSKWTAKDKSLVDADPVVWLGFGVTHIVRVEDFPVMPVETTGFTLKPFGFFQGNPGLDIPAGKDPASREHGRASPNHQTCCSNGASGPATPTP